MSTLALRQLRLFLPSAEVLLVTVLLSPILSATASDGPQDGQTWARNVFGWPLLAGGAGLAVWVGTAIVVATSTWLLISVRILRRIESDEARPLAARLP